MQLSGRHAIVTGGGSGIGAAIAHALSAEGAAVTLVGRSKEKLDRVAAKLGMAGVVTADVSREDDCAAMAEKARALHGPIDIAVVNAGAAESAPFGKIDLAHWRRMLDVNLTGAFLTAQAVLPDLKRAGAADGVRRQVFVASTAGVRGYPYVAAYCAAKHGVVGMMRALSAELAASGVTVNAVCPGYTDTPLIDASAAAVAQKTGQAAADIRAQLAQQNAHGRLVTPQEVAGSVLWLCSPAAASVSGQTIVMAGGEP
ncbi:MAG: SDR family NAD(P)-dependent oxidoreductase [Pseudolabrys sp.]